MANRSLAAAKSDKNNNEYYTQMVDIEREMNAYIDFDADVFRDQVILLPCDDPEWSNFVKFFALNFAKLGIKKLIATSFAPDSNPWVAGYQPTLFERKEPWFDETKTRRQGKLFTLERDVNGDGVVDIDDLQWEYLEGDGDFRSAEVSALRDEADVIITNPPFSLGREFLLWVLSGKKKDDQEKRFSIIGPNSFPTTKDVFPLIRDGKMWRGQGFEGGNAYFRVPETNRGGWASGVFDADKSLVKFRNVEWFTNLEHGQRHEAMDLMTMDDNLRYNKTLVRRGGYRKYDNFDAIDVPLTIAIPDDYDGVMGVPVSYLENHCPEQFDIVGITKTWDHSAIKKYPTQTQISADGRTSRVGKLNDGGAIAVDEPPAGKTCYEVDGQLYTQTYPRILIKRKKDEQ